MISTDDNGERYRAIGGSSDALCRMCIPARFPVKCIAYQAMLSRFGRLKAAGNSISLSATHEMRKLLGIVHEILEVESYPEDSELVSFEEQPPIDLACASCGGEIFQTAFGCKGTCLRDDTVGSSNGNKMVICPLCFVDGRTCGCGGMQPLRVREMGPLIKARDTVHDFIRGVAEKFLISKDELELVHTHSIFAAALVLHQRRAQLPVSQNCPLSGDGLS